MVPRSAGTAAGGSPAPARRQRQHGSREQAGGGRRRRPAAAACSREHAPRLKTDLAAVQVYQLPARLADDHKAAPHAVAFEVDAQLAARCAGIVQA